MSLLGCLVITEGYIVAYLATNLQKESYTIYKLLHDARLKVKQGLIEQGYEVNEVYALFRSSKT